MAAPLGYMGLVLRAPDKNRDDSDFRQVPASDRGNAAYRDVGQRGSFQTNETQFPNPEGVKVFEGYGADETDLVRGFCAPEIRNDPAFDAQNYRDRWTDPRVSNDYNGETDIMRDDWEFRGRNQRSRGFLTRPRVPTERG